MVLSKPALQIKFAKIKTPSGFWNRSAAIKDVFVFLYGTNSLATDIDWQNVKLWLARLLSATMFRLRKLLGAITKLETTQIPDDCSDSLSYGVVLYSCIFTNGNLVHFNPYVLPLGTFIPKIQHVHFGNWEWMHQFKDLLTYMTHMSHMNPYKLSQSLSPNPSADET